MVSLLLPIIYLAFISWACRTRCCAAWLQMYHSWARALPGRAAYR